MTQDEIIRMAREACAPNQTFNSDEEWVKRFAALVAAHEREKIEAQLKAIRPQGKSWLPMVLEAVLAEREACAKVCEEIAAKEWDAYKGRTEPIDRDKLYNPHIEGISDGADECAAAIRARGEK